MLNGRTILLQVFCVFFIFASAFGQEEADSHVLTVTQKILEKSLTLIGQDEEFKADIQKRLQVMGKR